MQIDWFTFGAQIVNFLVLLGLLKYYLYDRIIGAMDERKKSIAQKIEEADEKRKEAEKQHAELQEKQKKIDSEKEGILDKARKEAEKERSRMVDEAKEDVRHLRTRWQASLKDEQESFLRELRNRTARQVYRIAGNVLEDLADRDVQEQIVDVFINRIKSGKTEHDADLKKIASDEQADGVAIRSSFELSASHRQKMTRTVHEILGKELSVDYIVASDLLLGIVLQVGSSKIQWNAADYLESLQEETRSMLTELESRKNPSSEQEESNQASEADDKTNESNE
jgi:F-type H+-transporting ATPase subunit b